MIRALTRWVQWRVARFILRDTPWVEAADLRYERQRAHGLPWIGPEETPSIVAARTKPASEDDNGGAV